MSDLGRIVEQGIIGLGMAALIGLIYGITIGLKKLISLKARSQPSKKEE